MYCRNCGKEVDQQAVACPGCGVAPKSQKKFCFNCGQPTEAAQVICTKCGVGLAPSSAPGSKNKLVAGLLGILLGSLGIHKFYLGYTKEGIIMLVVSLAGSFITCGASSVVVWIVGLIEGIMYLTKTDEEFERVYVQGTKPWF